MLLLDLVAQNRWLCVVRSCSDLIMAIDFDMLFCPYDVVFHRVIVPHEGLGAGLPARRPAGERR